MPVCGSVQRDRNALSGTCTAACCQFDHAINCSHTSFCSSSKSEGMREMQSCMWLALSHTMVRANEMLLLTAESLTMSFDKNCAPMTQYLLLRILFL